MSTRPTIMFLITIFMFFRQVNILADTGESRLKLIGVDEETGTWFSVIEKIGGMPGAHPCRYGGSFVGLDVIGIVPSDVALSDDSIAKSLIEKAKNAALEACPSFKLGRSDLRIKLFIADYKLGQSEKPIVSAEWEELPFGSRNKETKGPTKYLNLAAEQFRKQQLAQERANAGIDASRIVVKEIHTLDTNSSYPRFSPDGSQILYSKEMQSESRSQVNYQVQIIKDVKTHKIIKTFGKSGTSRKGTWSPDSKKIAYFATPERGIGFIGVRGKLHIFDIASGKTVKLDYQEPAYGGFIVWAEKQEIYVLETGRYLGFSLNLDTLKESHLSEDVYSRYMKNASKDWWSDFSKHKYCYIYRESVKRGNPSLIVANKDDSYARVLIEGVYDQHPYVVSPDLTSVVYAQAGDLYIAYLGKREKSITEFKTQISDTTFMEKIDKALKNNIAIWGTVFGPRFNPLNNKLVGPEEKVFKGYVEFVKLDGSHFIVKTTFENKPFGNGDVISEIHSEDRSVGRNEFGLVKSDVWSVLENL